MIFSRKCKTCGKDIWYKTKNSLRTATHKNSNCKFIRLNNVKEKE